MINEHCFTEEWLKKRKSQKAHKNINTMILQKMIYALHLLESLKSSGLEFVFKGGTSLVLLLSKGNRFSIDIDIISAVEKDELEAILEQVVESSQFTKWTLDEHRSYKEGVPKAHYKFSFDSDTEGQGIILLDVLIEDSIYPEVSELPIATKWIETDEQITVTIPTIDAITGDKLTAFAPNTTGIPYFKGDDQQRFSKEIIKQLFDLSQLFEQVTNMETVLISFHAFAEKEINYRKKKTDLSPQDVLWDTIETCKIIARRGQDSKEDKRCFDELQWGINGFGSAYLMEGKFRIDDAIPAAARVAYLSAKILVKDLSPLAFYEGQDITELKIENRKWNALNRLKKQPDKSSFYYWYQTVTLLTNEK